MKKTLFFFTLPFSIFPLINAQDCTYINNTNSKVIITIIYKKVSTKECVTKTVYLSPKQKEVVSETQQDCLPYLFNYTAMDGALAGKTGSYEALLPISNSFIFNVNEGPNNLLFFDINQIVPN